MARIRFEEAAGLFRQIGETRWLILALTHLAAAHHALGDEQRALAMNEEALELAGESGDIRGAAIVRSNIGGSLFLEGHDQPAAALLRDALEGLRSVGAIYGWLPASGTWPG